MQVSQTSKNENIVTIAQQKSNDLIKIQRILHTCFKYLIKTTKSLKESSAPNTEPPPEGGEQEPNSFFDGGGSSEKNPENKKMNMKNEENKK